MELNAAKQDFEKRLSEKDEEFESYRKSHSRNVDALQTSIENESRSRADVTRQKKHLDNVVADLEATLESSNRARAELEKSVKRLQTQLREAQLSAEDEQRLREEVRALLDSIIHTPSSSTFDAILYM